MIAPLCLPQKVVAQLRRGNRGPRRVTQPLSCRGSRPSGCRTQARVRVQKRRGRGDHPGLEVFGEGNATRRRAAIEELYTEDCVLYAPPGIFVGPEALDKFAGDLRATHPHFVYTPHGEAQALHNAGRLAWGSGPRGESPSYTGLDVVVVRDGKIAALYVFLDSVPS